MKEDKEGEDEKCNKEQSIIHGDKSKGKEKPEKGEDSESQDKEVEGKVVVESKESEKTEKKEVGKGSGGDTGKSPGVESEGGDSQAAGKDAKGAVGEPSGAGRESHNDNKKLTGETKKGDVKNESESKHGSSKEEGFPKDLEGFGYEFNEGIIHCNKNHVIDQCCIEGHMVSSETGESFKFEVRVGDKKYNQKRYEALGEVSSMTKRLLFSYYKL